MHTQLNNRWGIVKISNSLYKSLSPEELSSFYAKFFPHEIDWKVSHDDWMGVFKGVSVWFDPLEDGEEIPEYSVTVYDNRSVEFERVEEQPIIPE